MQTPRPIDTKPANTLTLDVQPAENVCGSSLQTSEDSSVFCYGRWSRLTQSRVCQETEPWEARETVYYETFSLRSGARGWGYKEKQETGQEQRLSSVVRAQVLPSYGLHLLPFVIVIRCAWGPRPSVACRLPKNTAGQELSQFTRLQLEVFPNPPALGKLLWCSTCFLMELNMMASWASLC